MAEPIEWQNTYWVLRHGRSLANDLGIIVSSPENGGKPEYGLSEAGEAQAVAAGRLLLQQLMPTPGFRPESVVIYSSPFTRAMATAMYAAAGAGLDASKCLHVAPFLAERFFGSALELTSHDNYNPFWASDAVDPASRPPGSEDGESVNQVSERVAALLEELEQAHSGKHIVLVSHGDTLSILQATFYRTPLTQHRDYGLATAELKCLNPPAHWAALHAALQAAQEEH